MTPANRKEAPCPITVAAARTTRKTAFPAGTAESDCAPKSLHPALPPHATRPATKAVVNIPAGALSERIRRLATREQSLTVGELIERRMAVYTGRDTTMVQRLDTWRAILGGLRLDEPHGRSHACSAQRDREPSGACLEGRGPRRQSHLQVEVCEPREMPGHGKPLRAGHFECVFMGDRGAPHATRLDQSLPRTEALEGRARARPVSLR